MLEHKDVVDNRLIMMEAVGASIQFNFIFKRLSSIIPHGESLGALEQGQWTKKGVRLVIL
jgi:hypothetical protein